MSLSIYIDALIEGAFAAGARQRAQGLWATTARYDADGDQIELQLARGETLLFARSDLRELDQVPPSDLALLALSPSGELLELPRHDIAISVRTLAARLLPIPG